jgi:hypothetical protein
MESNVSLAIPALRNIEAAYTKALELRQIGFLGPILVSINAFGTDQGHTEIDERFRKLRCDLFIHKSDLGLYGNFKFLLDNIQTTHFMWVALDDFPPKDLLANNWIAPQLSDLTIGTIELVNYSDKGFGSRIETISPSKFFKCDELQIHPGFVFGVWRTEFLKKNWPKKSMDWLDTYVLFCARKFGKVQVSYDVGSWVIGYSQKSPHRVNGVFHNPLRWFRAVLKVYLARHEISQYINFVRVFAGKLHFGLIELLQSVRLKR